MDTVFLDANVLVSAALRPNAPLQQLWQLKDAKLVTSEYAAEEARRNLPKADQQAELERLTRELPRVRGIADAESLPNDLILPEKDLPILLAAMEAEATHLLTGDQRHFGPYYGRQIQGVLILRPAEYLKQHA